MPTIRLYGFFLHFKQVLKMAHPIRITSRKYPLTLCRSISLTTHTLTYTLFKDIHKLTHSHTLDL